MIAFETSVGIDRPPGEVFAYVSDPANLPKWNSAVRAVRRTSAGRDGVGSTYSMERDLPGGPATNTLEIVSSTPREGFAIRTTAGPTPFVYRYRFKAADGATTVQLDAQVELRGLRGFAERVAQRAVKKGVDDNLATLKRKLEAGRP
jgi:uncharacterized protein YndB with AHSA1/START domain